MSWNWNNPEALGCEDDYLEEKVIEEEWDEYECEDCGYISLSPPSTDATARDRYCICNGRLTKV